MKRNKLCCAAVLLALALTACGPTQAGEETPAPAPLPTAPPVETPAPETPVPAPVPQPWAWGEQTVSRTFTAGDGTVVMRISYVLPSVHVGPAGSNPAGEAVNAWYEAEGKARLREAEEAYEMAVADYEVSSAMGYAFEPTTQEMSSQVTYEAQGVVSVRRELYVSFGGAHPFVSCLSEQFDAATGEKLAFADFFTDTQTVMERVVCAFAAQDGLAGISEEEILAACQPENFYLTGDGYVFWIQGGSLPAVNSPIEAVIPFDQMSDVRAHG